MSDESPGGGISVAPGDLPAIEARWAGCWTPPEVARRLAGIDVPWFVAAGWALDLFRGEQTREHGDLEIGVPAGRFPQVRERFAGFAFDAVGESRIWESAGPDVLRATHQTWLRDPATGRYLLDVFREPHDGGTWICRRDEAIRRPYAEIIRRTADGIPYLAPEFVLLFKAKHARPKDEADFEGALPRLTARQRATLAVLLARVHPGHAWLDALRPVP
ncbi:nucleotidyltransferase domain-containing protein [Dactylosporangium sp. CA-139066]|uniref:nucleotidyltransferase domain-containing protein n=1 Tax=Dactylosporangium sp. CA-139066 TaxID=3239930 RepID=UPI003D91473C